MSDKKVVIITGASSGMGYETALRLIKEGYIVYGAARRVEKMQKIIDAGGHAVKLDITDHDSIVNAVNQVIKEQGRIDVLWNNAGYATYGAVEDVSLEDARDQFEVNIIGLADITKQVLPVMRKQKSGTIINTSSMGGKMYTALGAWYHATKHALEGWSDCLRIEVKQFGIDVVVLEPGTIATEFSEVLLDPMVKRAKNSPYEIITKKVAQITIDMSNKPNSYSPPSVISKTISKIIKDKKPKTRYVVGKMAKPMMFIRKWFGDTIFDSLIYQLIK